ncbi:MAG: hypothetical protein ACREA9_08355 [Pyrinomonadaceae bacterium]
MFTETFSLPGGYVDDEGVTHREVELAPVTGFEEELLDSVVPAVCSAYVVTALLSRCLRRVGKFAPVTASLVRDLLVGDREFLMLKLRELTLGKSLNAMLVCGDPKCAQCMDIALNLDDFTPTAKSVDRRVYKLDVVEGEETFAFEFRLSTGADQEAGSDWMGGDAESAVRRFLTRMILRINDNCSIDDQAVNAVPARVLKELEGRMEELGPLVSIDLKAACVECRRPSLTHLDLTSFFLDELQQSRRVLEREVHCIAWHYHWPEREILTLTRRKRRRYIELIRGDSSAALFAGTTVAMLQGQ